tara:strand:+ start:1485 stop:2588 length:1104 start_codon:yes stop_codon:yes gene_type:complete
MENKNKDRNFLGVWIPKDVYLNKDLSWSEKILLVEIESLDNQDGCFASNDYFADFLDVTKTTISTAISKLKKLGYVEQVSFDGRRRVLKICESAYKKTEMQTTEKPETSINENLKHNNTDIKPSKNQNKIQKINKKENFNLNKNDLKKINDIESGSICIEVDELKTNQVWLEHASRHLKLSMYWIDQLLKEFISEQKLKDDSFKSIREQKSHFLNWSKIQVAKNRKFNDRWGRFDPPHAKPKIKKVVEQKNEPTPEEKKQMHLEFLQTSLIDPYNKFLKTGQFVKIRDFGNLVSNELKKNQMLFNDMSVISKYKDSIPDPKPQKNNQRLSALMNTNKKDQMVKDFIFRKTFENLKEKKVDLEKILLK